MKCPLKMVRVEEPNTTPYYRTVDCLKEECAWWSKAVGACSILGLETSLSLIGAILLEMKDKMPHANQFTK